MNGSAAISTWSGTTDADFANAGNWDTLPADDVVTDFGRFATHSSGNQPMLGVSRAIHGLVFDAPGGGWTLAGNGTLTLGGGGISTVGQSSGETVLALPISLSSTQTWQVGGGGVLRVNRSVLAGEPGAPLPGQWIVGGSNAGDLILDPLPGHSVALFTNQGSAGAIQVHQRLVLGSGPGSTAAVNTLSNLASAGIRLSNQASLEVRSGEWRTNDLGSNNTGAFTGYLTISGGSLVTGGARYLGQVNGTVGTRIRVAGGSLVVTGGGNVVANAGHLGLGAYGANGPNGTISFDVVGGLVDVARGAGNFPAGSGISSAALSVGGLGNTTVLFNQSAGMVKVGVTTGSHVFNNSPNANSYSNLSIGSNLPSTHAAYTLGGGTLVVSGSVQGVASPGGTSNLNFVGGILAVGSVNATQLGHAPSASTTGNQTAGSSQIGTLVNRGGILAPGGMAVAGRTVITGNYTAQAGSLAVDLGGTTQASGFQSGGYDFVSITGNAVLGGNLSVSRLGGFSPAANQTWTVLTAAAVSGEFANVLFGQRVVTDDGLGTFVVSRVGGNVTLSNFVAVSAPEVRGSFGPSQALPGDAVVLGITVESLAAVTYEWRKDGVPLEGASGPSLTILGASSSDSGLYEVTARNAAGSVTRSFPLAVVEPPVAGSVVVDAGANHTFSAANGTLSRAWFLNGEPVGNATVWTYAPTRKEYGSHWIRLVETHPGNATVARDWIARVRIPIPASPVTFHVAPNGSDAGDGSVGAPFLTLERARDAIRALQRPLAPGGVTVYLRGGSHRRTATFSLNASDSGTEVAPIVYCAFPGETPMLTTSKPVTAAQCAPLALSEHFRVPPGTDPARIWEVDVTGNPRANSFPNVFNEWWIFNALRSSQNGGLLEVFRNGERMRLSRYPNAELSDDRLTPNLLMDGVATGVANDGSGHLNTSGNYTTSNGTVVPVSAAFHFRAEEVERVARWQTALDRGGVWLMGYWRVPWQLNAARVGVLDVGSKRTIGFQSGANISNGIGDKYMRPVGSRKEPYWVINLLEELDQPGEWCMDFNRKRLYFLMDRDGAPADGEIEISDVGTPLIQGNATSDVIFRGLGLRRHLGIGIQILGGNRVLVAGCTFEQVANMAVDINGGTTHGVVSSHFEKLASGGVMLRGGQTSPSVTPANHFAVNNSFQSFSEVVRVYQAAVDIGYGGPMGNWGLPTVGMRAAHNRVRSSPHAAILWNGHNHIIEFNDISDFTRISNDLGAIYRFGPNMDARTSIRFNHIYNSPLGEGIYNDFDHVRTPIHGNVINLKTSAAGSRGHGIWTTTNTTPGGAVAGLPMTLNVRNNISVNGRNNYVFHSATGGTIENNLSYRKLAADFSWTRVTTSGGTHSTSSSNASTLASGPNIAYATDPGFVDFANDDLRLRPNAQALRDMPDFVPIPLEMAGIENDELRGGARVWTPFVVTEKAAQVGANSALFRGRLVYPQFERNATARVYWGTADGGADADAWEFVTPLGQPASGALSIAPTDLEPSTRYFYRFHAVNAAGEHWAEQSESTTTYSLQQVQGGGNATASGEESPATGASLAFDGNLATVWRPNANGQPASLTYQLPAGGMIVATAYEIVSAPDAPGRDPKAWRLEGSLDGIQWVQLDARTNETFASRGEARRFGFASQSPYRLFRLVVEATADGSATQVAELRLLSPVITPDTTGPVISTPGTLTVSGNASGAIVTFEVSALDALTGNTPATASPPSGSFFPVGNTTVTVTATDLAGNTSNASFGVIVTPPSLPPPWTIQQIKPYAGVAAGTIEVLGPASFRIIGAGGAASGGVTGDLWTGANDSNTYVSLPWQGDGVFTARVASFESSDSSAKAGIIFRETTASGSRYSCVYMIRGNGGAAHFQHKVATNGSSSGTNFFNGSVSSRGIPEWIRLVRRGDVFTVFYSENGTGWTQLGPPRTNVMSGSQLSVGFVIAPRTGNATATATFDNISFLTPLQDWRRTHFGLVLNSGNAADGADPDGDGFVNLIEYALGSIPSSPSSLPYMDLDVVEVEGEPGRFLELSFIRIADPALTYRVEAGSLLSNEWTTIWQSSGLANTAGPTTVIDSGHDLTLTGAGRRFLRLKVTTP
jgi:hypothetical protein